MNAMALLIPIGLVMGALGLVAFLWSLRTGQYEDMRGAAERILTDDEDDPPDPSRP
jgi:cbb3-type cytochrome oxidase maturation protein